MLALLEGNGQLVQGGGHRLLERHAVLANVGPGRPASSTRTHADPDRAHQRGRYHRDQSLSRVRPSRKASWLIAA